MLQSGFSARLVKAQPQIGVLLGKVFGMQPQVVPLNHAKGLGVTAGQPIPEGGGAAYWPCMIAATLGNFLGGMSCYWLGMLGKVEWIEKYLKLDPVKLQKVQDWIKGKGSWMGFFVFLPGIGDFIAVALGFLRANIWVVAISMFLGKAIRY